HAVKDVLALVAVLVAEDGVGEFLPVTSGPAKIDVQRGPSAGRIDLIFEVEGGAVLAVRAAVNIDDHRMPCSGGHAQRLGEKGFDLEFVVVAGEGKGLDFAELLAVEDFRVQIGEFAWSCGADLQIKVG